MKKSLLFLLLSCLFSESALTVDKKNLIIGGVGAVIFGVSTCFKFYIYSEFNKQYEDFKNIDFDDIFQQFEKVKDNNNENEDILKNIYLKCFENESNCEVFFKDFNFSKPYGDGKRIPNFKKLLEQLKTGFEDYQLLKSQLNFSSGFDALIILGAYLNQKKNWF